MRECDYVEFAVFSESFDREDGLQCSDPITVQVKGSFNEFFRDNSNVMPIKIVWTDGTESPAIPLIRENGQHSINYLYRTYGELT